MSRFFGFVFAACLVAIWTPTTVAAANPDWPKSLLLVTASPGGVYYVYGEELAQILTDRLGLTINTFPAPSAIHNIKLLDSGGAQLALITMATGRAGWNGTGAWTDGKQFRNMRALFPMYDNPFKPWSWCNPALRTGQSSPGNESASARGRGTAASMVRLSSRLSGFHRNSLMDRTTR